MQTEARQSRTRGEYLPKVPARRTGGTGGREYWTEQRIRRIREMATAGTHANPEALSQFQPLHDEPGAPYLLEDRLVLVPAAGEHRNEDVRLGLQLGQLELAQPTILGEFSYGATTAEVHEAAAMAADELGLLFGVGEGGWYTGIRSRTRIMLQVASGVFGITGTLLQSAAAISIKMAQSAKPGAGGHVKAHKITADMAETRGMPLGIDYLSDANRVVSIEELRQIVESARRASRGRPILIKCAATHDLAFIAAGAVAAGADGIIIDGRGGGTGATPTILRNNVCMPIELAVARAHDTVAGMTDRRQFKIIAAGRVGLPEKAFKLMLLGADAVMLSSAALISMGCVMVHQCHTHCPVQVATHKMREGQTILSLNAEWAAEMLTNYLKAFGGALRQYAGAYGFADISDVVGRRGLLRSIAMEPELMQMLGVERADGFENIEMESANLWNAEIAEPHHQWQLEHNTALVEHGTIEVGSMGRTTDLDSPRSYLDAIISEGRHVVGPSYDAYRDGIETRIRMPGRTRLDIPMIVGAGEGAGRIETLKAVAGRKSLAVMEYSELAALLDSGERAEVLSRARSIMLRFDKQAESDIGKMDVRLLENVASIIVPAEYASKEAISRISVHTDRPIYATVTATGNIENDVINAASSGVDGIIIRGRIGIRQFELGNNREMPLELAVPLADEALRSAVREGKVLRRKVSLFAEGNARTTSDIYMLCALGANCVIGTGLMTAKGPVGGREEMERYLNGLKRDMQVMMGAGGVSMMSSVTGNRGLLRADEMPPEIRRIMGITLMGA